MKCFACDDGLGTNPAENLDPETDRYYCSNCNCIINDTILENEMENEPKKPENTSGEVPLLDEDFDGYIEENDFLDVPFDEEDLPDFNLPPENYDE